MIVASWIAALAALATTVANVIGSVRHRNLDNTRFAEQSGRIERIEKNGNGGPSAASAEQAPECQ